MRSIKSQDKPQLFLLHFAGGNCYSMLFLKEYLNNNFELHFLELPGRGKRLAEPLLHTSKDAITDYFLQIKALRNQEDFLIYGHSMGAFLGFFVSEKLEKLGDSPIAFIASGNASPKCIPKKDRHLMPTTVLKEELLKMGGMPIEVIQDKEMFDFFNPIIRADFEIIEKHTDSLDKCQIDVPIYALMGDEEELVSSIKEWALFTTNNLYSKVTKGDHFFIKKYPKSIVKVILEAYQKMIPSISYVK